MRLSSVVNKFGGQLNGDCEIQAVSTDTRTLKSGDVFVALKGPNFDGDKFLSKALELGAGGVVSESDFEVDGVCVWTVENCFNAFAQIAQMHREQFSPVIVAITGSAGKTTVKGMLASICGFAGHVHYTDGNLNNHIGVPHTLMGLKASHRYAVIEAGTSGKGEIKHLAKMIRPNVALVNNVMPVHVEGLGSVSGIAEEKASIYDEIDDGGIAVINFDSEYRDYFLKRCSGKKIVGFTLDPTKKMEGIVTGSKLDVDVFGRCKVSVSIDGKKVISSLQVLGDHNISNAVAAATCAHAMGIGLNEIQKGLDSYVGTPGRMQLHDRDSYTVIDDTYNANPEAMKAAVDYLSNFESTLLVCGDMGELGEGAFDHHTDVARYARKKGVTELFAVGGYAEGYQNGFGDGARAFRSKRELIDELTVSNLEGKTILVKGSRSASMETVVTSLLERRY